MEMVVPLVRLKQALDGKEVATDANKTVGKAMENTDEKQLHID